MKIDIAKCKRIKFVLGSFVTLLSTAFTTNASAERIPDSYSGNQYYKSTSMKPVTVHFMWPNFYGPDSKIRDTVQIPRAYIIFAAAYASRPVKRLGKFFAESQKQGYDKLPDNIQTDSIRIMTTYPDGKPYTVALTHWGRKARETHMGTTLARANTYDARITYVARSLSTPLASHTIKNENGAELSEYDGLLYNPKRSNPNYYNKPADPFFYATCSDPLEKAKPVVMCNYAVPLGKNYLAMVSFLDFRLFGGRKFADERIEAFQSSMCRFFPC